MILRIGFRTLMLSALLAGMMSVAVSCGNDDEEGDSTGSNGVNVDQSELYLYAVPTDIVTLNNSIAYALSPGSRVDKMYCLSMSAAECGQLSDEELKTRLRNTNAVTRNQIAYSVFGRGDLSAGTDYVVCTMGVDSEGKDLPLLKTPVKTSEVMVYSPRTVITSATFAEGTKVRATFTMNDYASSYFTDVYMENNLSDCCDAQIAFLLRMDGEFCISKNVVGEFPVSDPNEHYVVCTWSQGKDGTMSDVIVRSRSISSSIRSNSPMRRQPGRSGIEYRPQKDGSDGVIKIMR